MGIDSTVSALEAIVKTCETDLRLANTNLHTERLRVFTASSGIEVGSLVEERNGDVYRITEISCKYSSIYLYGNPRKKNGEIGIARRYVASSARPIALEA